MGGSRLCEACGCSGQHAEPCNLVLAASLQCFKESPGPHPGCCWLGVLGFLMELGQLCLLLSTLQTRARLSGTLPLGREGPVECSAGAILSHP